MAPTVEPVVDRRGLDRFVDFAWAAQGSDPHWVPPLKIDVRKLLTPGQHPFHEHGEVQPFLALRGGKVVGRIVAHTNAAHNDFHGDRVGFFGFFDLLEGEDEAGAALFERAFAWLRERDRSHARGPFELSTNETCGLLVDGEPGPPMVMMPHNPRWYARHYEAAGLTKAKDLYAFLVRRSGIPEKLLGMAGPLMDRYGVRMRSLRMKDFDAEVERVLGLYNRCWERNWGFVPMTDGEIRHTAQELRHALDPRLVLFLERRDDGEPLGFIFALPDLNQALRHANGRLFPFGLLKILWHKRRIHGLRVLTLGVVPEMRGKGLDGLIIQELVRRGDTYGHDTAECSWVLEDNMPMVAPLLKFAGDPYRTYRIYEKEL